jgi:uncharacterized membrane protein
MISTLLHHASTGISLVGVAVITYGVLVGLAGFARSELDSLRHPGTDPQRAQLRQLLGCHLLLGLEFLIAADIIETLMKPAVNDFKDLIVLGSTIIVRTVISRSLDAELKAVQESKAG